MSMRSLQNGMVQEDILRAWELKCHFKEGTIHGQSWQEGKPFHSAET